MTTSLLIISDPINRDNLNYRYVTITANTTLFFMEVDSDSSSTCSVSSADSESSLCDELQHLVAHCEALHLHHHTALELLERIQMLLDREEGITVHYQCEDRDFGEVLETLHAGVLENIWAGRDTRFGDVLLEALSYSSVVDGP
jgi:hypothetical protein